jgi:hypothetical protein
VTVKYFERVEKTKTKDIETNDKKFESEWNGGRVRDEASLVSTGNWYKGGKIYSAKQGRANPEDFGLYARLFFDAVAAFTFTFIVSQGRLGRSTSGSSRSLMRSY